MNNEHFIETSRLAIRPLIIEDAEALFAILSNQEVMEFSFSGPYKNIEQTQDFIQNSIDHYKEYSFHFWGIEYKDEQFLIEICGLLIQEIDSQKRNRTCVSPGQRMVEARPGHRRRRSCSRLRI